MTNRKIDTNKHPEGDQRKNICIQYLFKCICVLLCMYWLDVFRKSLSFLLNFSFERRKSLCNLGNLWEDDDN